MAWQTVVLVILFILGVLAIPTAIIITVVTNRGLKKRLVEPNQPMFEMNDVRRVSFTDGYSQGVLHNRKPMKNGTFYISFYPDDVHQGNVAPRPDLKSLIVHKDYIETIPVGDGVSRREKIKIIPRFPDSIPKSLKGTSEGNILEKQSIMAFLSQNQGKVLRNSFEAFSEYTDDETITAISKKKIKQMSDDLENIKKMASSVSERKSE